MLALIKICLSRVSQRLNIVASLTAENLEWLISPKCELKYGENLEYDGEFGYITWKSIIRPKI